MPVSMNKPSKGAVKSGKKLPIKLSNNAELDQAISRANNSYLLRFRLSRRLESCLLKDPNLKEEHCKGKTFLCTVFLLLIRPNTVEPRYLELAYFELPHISKWKYGPCFNM